MGAWPRIDVSCCVLYIENISIEKCEKSWNSITTRHITRLNVFYAYHDMDRRWMLTFIGETPAFLMHMYVVRAWVWQWRQHVGCGRSSCSAHTLQPSSTYGCRLHHSRLFTCVFNNVNLLQKQQWTACTTSKCSSGPQSFWREEKEVKNELWQLSSAAEQVIVSNNTIFNGKVAIL